MRNEFEAGSKGSEPLEPFAELIGVWSVVALHLFERERCRHGYENELDSDSEVHRGESHPNEK